MIELGDAERIWRELGAPGSIGVLAGQQPWAPIEAAMREAIAEEREAGARIADERQQRYGEPDGEWSRGVADAFAQIAVAIRARGGAWTPRTS